MNGTLHRLAGIVLLLAGDGSGIARGAEPVEILDRTFAALGGRQAIADLRSLSTDAECEGPGGRFRTRVDSLRPGYVRFVQSAGDETTEIWSTSARTWRDDGDAGTRDLDEGVRRFVRAHEFHMILFELEDRFSNHRPGRAAVVGERPCRSILMEDETGRPATLFIAAGDGLPLALELNPPETAGPIRITFDDWRPIEGLRCFFSFTLSEGTEETARTFTYRYRSVTPNGVLAERFVPRAGVRERADQEAILAILRDERRAHLEGDAALLTSRLADSLVEISNGEIHVRSRPEVEAFFAGYFEAATYRLWEDARPPLIRFSTDLEMAWVARQVIARLEERDAPGNTAAREFASAFTATYEKRDGRWTMTSVTSTFRPE